MIEVSCVCLTYNRAPGSLNLVAEAVESYLRQGYPPERRQLLIVNDTPGQALHVPPALVGADGSGVQVLNLPFRFRTLGEKYTAAMGLAQGRILMWWDDDDISLPHRVSTGVERLQDASYYDTAGYWFLDAAGLHHDHGIGPGFNCSAFTRYGYERAAAMSFGMDLDAVLERSFRSIPGLVKARNVRGPHEWSYVYRWGVSSEHVSGWGTGDGEHTPASPGYFERGRRPIQRGKFLVEPRWDKDYPAMVRSYLEAI